MTDRIKTHPSPLPTTAALGFIPFHEVAIRRNGGTGTGTGRVHVRTYGNPGGGNASVCDEPAGGGAIAGGGARRRRRRRRRRGLRKEAVVVVAVAVEMAVGIVE